MRLHLEARRRPLHIGRHAGSCPQSKAGSRSRGSPLQELARKRGPKPSAGKRDGKKLRKLERKNARLREELRKPRIVTEVQGKVSGRGVEPRRREVLLRAPAVGGEGGRWRRRGGRERRRAAGDTRTDAGGDRIPDVNRKQPEPRPPAMSPFPSTPGRRPPDTARCRARLRALACGRCRRTTASASACPS